jgi:hypothetical protein
MPPHFGFGRLSAPPTPAEIDPTTIGRDWGPQAAPVLGNINFMPGHGAPEPPAPWKPGFGDVLQAFLFNPGSWNDAQASVANQHASTEHAARARQLLDAAMVGKTPEEQAAIRGKTSPGTSPARLSRQA